MAVFLTMPRAEWFGAKAEVLAIHHRIRHHRELSEIAEEAAFQLIYERRPRMAASCLRELAQILPGDAPLSDFVKLVALRLSEYDRA